MRNELVEGLLVGAVIGLAIIAIRTLMAGASTLLQALALLLVGIALGVAQLVLVLRRADREETPQHGPVESRQAPVRRPGRRHDPFARELTGDWTGLDERISGRDAERVVGAEEPDAHAPNEPPGDQPAPRP